MQILSPDVVLHQDGLSLDHDVKGAETVKQYYKAYVDKFSAHKVVAVGYSWQQNIGFALWVDEVSPGNTPLPIHKSTQTLGSDNLASCMSESKVEPGISLSWCHHWFEVACVPVEEVVSTALGTAHLCLYSSRLSGTSHCQSGLHCGIQDSLHFLTFGCKTSAIKGPVQLVDGDHLPQ